MADQSLIIPQEKPSVLIIGGGSLGNGMEFALLRLGIHPDILDHDKWERSNRLNCVNPDEPQVPKGSTHLQLDLEGCLRADKPLSNYDVIVTATDNLESRSLAYRALKPKLGFLDMRTGLHTATIVRGNSEWMLDHLPEGETENYGCGQIGSMAHTMTISGLATLRLLEGVKDTWTNQYSQIGIFGKQVTHLSLDDQVAQNAEEEEPYQSPLTQEMNIPSPAPNVDRPAPIVEDLDIEMETLTTQTYAPSAVQ